MQSLRLNLIIFVRKLWNEVHESFQEVWHTKKAIITWIRSRATILWYSFTVPSILGTKEMCRSQTSTKQQHLNIPNKQNSRETVRNCAARCPRNPARWPPKRCMLLSAGRAWMVGGILLKSSSQDSWRSGLINAGQINFWFFDPYSPIWIVEVKIVSDFDNSSGNVVLFSNQIWFKKVRVYFSYFILSLV